MGGIATRYWLDGPGLELRWEGIFRILPDRSYGAPSFLYNGYQVSFLGQSDRGVALTTQPPSSAEVK